MYYNKHSIIYHNGKFVNPAKTTIDLYGQTLHYGNGVFEGIRAYNTPNGTVVFKAKEHYERLLKGAKVMNLNFNYSVEEMIKITYELLEKNELTDAYIRPLITTGASMALLSSEESTLTIQTWKWERLHGDDLLSLGTSSFQRPNPKSCFVETKITGHYINSILAKNEAKANGFNEALLLDMNENVAEASGANIFMEKNGQLFTTPKGHIMAGITRNTVIDICKREGIPIKEQFFTLSELKRADSAFLTGTAAEVAGIKSLDNNPFPLDWNNSLGAKLSGLYKNEVLGKQLVQTVLKRI